LSGTICFHKFLGASGKVNGERVSGRKFKWAFMGIRKRKNLKLAMT